MRILVVNCGSSSIKFAVVDMAADRTLANGIVERIGEEVGTSRWRHRDTEHTEERPFADHHVGVSAVIDAVAVLVIPTDEEGESAEQTAALLDAGGRRR